MGNQITEMQDQYCSSYDKRKDVYKRQGVEVVEGGQAVHEDGVRVGISHNFLVHLVRLQQLDALGDVYKRQTMTITAPCICLTP